MLYIIGFIIVAIIIYKVVTLNLRLSMEGYNKYILPVITKGIIEEKYIGHFPTHKPFEIMRVVSENSNDFIFDTNKQAVVWYEYLDQRTYQIVMMAKYSEVNNEPLSIFVIIER